jgi:NADH-quinone oxidoreductase subunit N
MSVEQQIIENVPVQEMIKLNIQERLFQIFPPFEIGFYGLFAPLLIMTLTALVVLVAGVFTKRHDETNPLGFALAILGTFISLACLFFMPTSLEPKAYLASGILSDEITRLSFMVILGGSLLSLLLLNSTSFGKRLVRYESLFLLLLSTIGLLIAVASGEFMSFFVGIEMTSLALYVLIAFQRKDKKSMEASFKYFIMGAAASATMLMGAAFIYAYLGSLRWYDFSHLTFTFKDPLPLLGSFFLFTGLSFKLGLAPFHMWSPDVYQGAQAHLTGYMSSLVKFSVAMVILRLLTSLPQDGSLSNYLFYFFALLSFISIIIGSLFGMVSNSVKRLLAYSSVANAGYLGITFACLAKNPASLLAKEALMSYAIIYAFLSLVSFAFIGWMEDNNREDLYKGELLSLGSRNALLSTLLTIFLFALGGIPPLAGFIGKFIILFTAFQEGLIGLGVTLLFFSLFSMGYYLSLVVKMWFTRPSELMYQPLKPSSFVTQTSMKILGSLFLILLLLLTIKGPTFSFQMNYAQAFETKPEKK